MQVRPGEHPARRASRRLGPGGAGPGLQLRQRGAHVRPHRPGRAPARDRRPAGRQRLRQVHAAAGAGRAAGAHHWRGAFSGRAAHRPQSAQRAGVPAGEPAAVAERHRQRGFRARFFAPAADRARGARPARAGRHRRRGPGGQGTPVPGRAVGRHGAARGPGARAGPAAGTAVRRRTVFGAGRHHPRRHAVAAGGRGAPLAQRRAAGHARYRRSHPGGRPHRADGRTAGPHRARMAGGPAPPAPGGAAVAGNAGIRRAAAGHPGGAARRAPGRITKHHHDPSISSKAHHDRSNSPAHLRLVRLRLRHDPARLPAPVRIEHRRRRRAAAVRGRRHGAAGSQGRRPAGQDRLPAHHRRHAAAGGAWPQAVRGRRPAGGNSAPVPQLGADRGSVRGGPGQRDPPAVAGHHVGALRRQVPGQGGGVESRQRLRAHGGQGDQQPDHRQGRPVGGDQGPRRQHRSQGNQPGGAAAGGNGVRAGQQVDCRLHRGRAVQRAGRDQRRGQDPALLGRRVEEPRVLRDVPVRARYRGPTGVGPARDQRHRQGAAVDALQPDRRGAPALQRRLAPLHAARAAGAHQGADRDRLRRVRKARRDRPQELEPAPHRLPAVPVRVVHRAAGARAENHAPRRRHRLPREARSGIRRARPDRRPVRAQGDYRRGRPGRVRPAGQPAAHRNRGVLTHVHAVEPAGPRRPGAGRFRRGAGALAIGRERAAAANAHRRRVRAAGSRPRAGAVADPARHLARHRFEPAPRGVWTGRGRGDRRAAGRAGGQFAPGGCCAHAPVPAAAHGVAAVVDAAGRDDAGRGRRPGVLPAGVCGRVADPAQYGHRRGAARPELAAAGAQPVGHAPRNRAARGPAGHHGRHPDGCAAGDRHHLDRAGAGRNAGPAADAGRTGQAGLHQPRGIAPDHGRRGPMGHAARPHRIAAAAHRTRMDHAGPGREPVRRQGRRPAAPVPVYPRRPPGRPDGQLCHGRRRRGAPLRFVRRVPAAGARPAPLAHRPAKRPEPDRRSAAQDPGQFHAGSGIRAGTGRHAVPAAALRPRRRGHRRLPDLFDRLPVAVVPGAGRRLPAVHGRLDRPAGPLRRSAAGSDREAGRNPARHARDHHRGNEQSALHGRGHHDFPRPGPVAQDANAVPRQKRVHQRCIVRRQPCRQDHPGVAGQSTRLDGRAIRAGVGRRAGSVIYLFRERDVVLLRRTKNRYNIRLGSFRCLAGTISGKQMKKSLLIVSLLAVALTACSKKEEAPVAPAPVAAPEAAPVVTPAPAADAAAAPAADAAAAASQAASAAADAAAAASTAASAAASNPYTLLLQLIEQHVEDFIADRRGFRFAGIGQHGHGTGIAFTGFDQDVITLRFLVRFRRRAPAEQFAEEALAFHRVVDIADEVRAGGAVAVFHRKAGAVQRQAHAAPGAIETFVHLHQAIGARAHQRGMLRLHNGRIHGRLDARRILLVVAIAQAGHQLGQEFRFQTRIVGTRGPDRGFLLRALQHFLHAAMADVDFAGAVGAAFDAGAELVALARRIDRIEDLADRVTNEILRDLGAVLGPVGFHDAGGRQFLRQFKTGIFPELGQLRPQLLGRLLDHQPALVAVALDLDVVDRRGHHGAHGRLARHHGSAGAGRSRTRSVVAGSGGHAIARIGLGVAAVFLQLGQIGRHVQRGRFLGALVVDFIVADNRVDHAATAKVNPSESGRDALSTRAVGLQDAGFPQGRAYCLVAVFGQRHQRQADAGWHLAHFRQGPLDRHRVRFDEQLLMQREHLVIQGDGLGHVAGHGGGAHVGHGARHDVGGDRDVTGAAGQHQRHGGGIVARVHGKIGWRQAQQVETAGDIAGGILDADDVGDPGQAQDGVVAHVGHGAARHVVQDHRQIHRFGNCLEVLEHALLRGTVIVRHDLQRGVGARFLGKAGQLDRFGRGIGARAGNDRNAALGMGNRRLDQRAVFFHADGGRFTGGAGDHDAVRTFGNVPVDQLVQALEVQTAVSQRRQQGRRAWKFGHHGADALHHRLLGRLRDAVFERHHAQAVFGGQRQQFARLQQVVGIRRLAELGVAIGEGFVDQHAIGRQAAQHVRHQRPVQVVGDHDAGKALGTEGPRGALLFQVDRRGGDAGPGRRQQRFRIAVDGQHRVAQHDHVARVAAGAAGKVQHFAAGHQRRVALHPGRDVIAHDVFTVIYSGGLLKQPDQRLQQQVENALYQMHALDQHTGQQAELQHHDQADEHEQAVALDLRILAGQRQRQDAGHDAAAIERRQRDQVENAHGRIDAHPGQRHLHEEFMLVQVQAIRVDHPQRHPAQAHDEVGAGTGRSHERHLLARIAQPFVIDRHRLGIAQRRQTHQRKAQRQQDGAEQVDMARGIDAQAAHVGGRGVAEIAGHIAVGRLVQGNCKKNGNGVDRDGLDDAVDVHGAGFYQSRRKGSLGFGARQVDHGGGLHAAGAAVNHQFQLLAEALADGVGIVERFRFAGHDQGGAQQRLAQFGQQRIDDGVLGHAQADGLARRMAEPARHDLGRFEDEGSGGASRRCRAGGAAVRRRPCRRGGTPAHSRSRDVGMQSGRQIAQRGNALFERRMGGEQRAPATAGGNAGCRNRLRQRARMHAVQARQRMLHRHRAAQQLGGTGVGAEFALAREPGHDQRRRQAEHQLAHEHGGHVAEAHALAFGIFQQHAVNKEADDACQKHHERIDHALDQRHGHHVAIGDVRHLVAQHGFHFVLVHALEQAGGHGHQRRIFKRAGGKRIRLARVHSHFGHADAGALGQPAHGIDQPRFRGVSRLVDHARAGGPLGHRFADQQRKNRAGKADHQRKRQQAAQFERVAAARPAHAQQRQDDGQHQHHGKVGGDKQDDAFHRCLRADRIAQVIRYERYSEKSRGGRGAIRNPHCAAGVGPQPVVPDGRDIGRQRRQRGKVDPRLARRMEVRAARGQETVMVGQLRVHRVLVRGVAASHHLDGGAAQLLELVEQLALRQLAEAVAARVGDHGNTARAADPAHGFGQRAPGMGHVAGPAFGQIFFKDFGNVGAGANIDQVARKVGARHQVRVAHELERALVGAVDAGQRQLARDFAAAVVAPRAGAGQAFRQLAVVLVDMKADDVHGFLGPGDGNFHARHKPHALLDGRHAGGGNPAHLVVVGQRPHVHAALARVLGHGGRRHDAVGNVGMAVQVDFKHVRSVSG
uniref:Uncharacterized protein n=1 Tax=Tanacetum cinerariifolium TaxID=118510 RepID=A0A699GEX1_TANCI|nr:hypothetical protein [Tanacetum cinerariifolium]